MKRNLFFTVLLAAGITANAQTTNVEVASGQYSADWNSLSGWECPEWFKDAKFGIWAHWGPQCHAEDGDWYARFMYYAGSGQYDWHVNHFDYPDVFGLKDLCNDWKAQNWDPEKLVNLYKSVGARYFMALGNHHDNFDLWNSTYQEWNSVNVGPKKDLARGWSDACKKAGLPFGVSIHASHAWTWLEPSQVYDGNLTKADGVGKWWEGLDPQELYAQNHEHSTGWQNSGSIHSQWDWGNGASLPSEEYKMKFQNRVLQLINDYQPDMLYFDDTAMPFYGCDDNIGKNILTHYYNKAAAQAGGQPQVVVTGKQLNSSQKQYMLWDVERGIPDRIQDEYWQTCTCIGSWHYDINVYNRGGYKGAQQVVDMLVDIVSKNGNMLLSVPVRSDGTIDDKEEAILAGIKAWMDINAKSIYGTRPWKTFGEGPLADAANPLSAQGFNEGNNYSSSDVRYVQKGDTLFATIMRWPAGKSFTFKCLGKTSSYYSGKVESLKLLGYGDVSYTEDVDGLTVTLPGVKPNDIAPVFQMTFVPGTDTPATLQEVIGDYEAKLTGLVPSKNTGRFNKEGINTFKAALEEARQHLTDSEANQKVVIAQLSAAYQKLLTEGRNQPDVPADNYEEDITVAQLVEASNFTASEMGSRFGTPENWTVENYSISMTNGDTKNGIDGYPGHNTLMLGRWKSEEVLPIESDIANARIYRKVHLTPGTYYFGQLLETSYNLPETSYLFAATHLLATHEVEDEALAFAQMKQAVVGKWFGLSFYIDEEQDIVLGWQADLSSGATEQEFRVKEVKLLSYGEVNGDALYDLTQRAWLLLYQVQINSNTGFYKREAADKLKAEIEKAEEAYDNEDEQQIALAYEALQKAIEDFQKNGKNMGGTPVGSDYEDITVNTLHEADNFARTEETNDGDRFGAPQHWTVENFGFGDQAGIDGIKGYDCLHLEVWWNNNAFAENGYDIKNARLYQQVELPAGRYFFGAAYPSAEANDASYIFASESILDTEDMEERSIAYEKVNVAPADGTFRGIYFTLEQPTNVYLGFQADFSNSVTNNVRVQAVKLLYYGELTYSKLKDLIATVEEQANSVKVNDNTGHYSQQAYDKLKAIVDEAKTTPETADYTTISTVYNKLSEALTDFLQNGRIGGTQPDMFDATDITIETLKEADNFARTPETDDSDRFGAPLNWTVENFGFGDQAGIDRNPGYDCLHLEVWWNNNAYAENGYDIQNVRLYQQVELPEGRYYFGAAYPSAEANESSYIFASESILSTEDIPTQSIAFEKVNVAPADGTFRGLNFTLDEPKKIYLGFQADFSNSSTNNIRVKAVKLLSYAKDQDAVISIMQDERKINDTFIYDLQGRRIQRITSPGMYIYQGRKMIVK